MKKKFKNIGLMGKSENPEARSTFSTIVDLLSEFGCKIHTVPECAETLGQNKISVIPTDEIAKKSDLIIVIGGDGSFLEAARACVMQNIPMIGVNRGRKGFLTDLSPQAIKPGLEPILKGQYIEEKRFLLELITPNQSKDTPPHIALNDIVLFNGNVATMMDFEVSVDGLHVYKQRSDGMIIATPTGSTAYALSGGGPILHPSLNATVLVPMHPHTLSNRPIVIPNDATINLTILPSRNPQPKLSCDGQVYLDAHIEDTFTIKKFKHQLRLLHPNDYDYFHTLRSKLGWSS
jgi:NAD+ kinase